MKRFSPIALLLLTMVLPVQADMSLKELVELGQKNNIELNRAYNNLEEAKENMGWRTELENTRLSLNGNYDYQQESPEPHDVSAQASITVPVIPQISLSGMVSSKGTGKASVSFAPFASCGTTYKDEETYYKALLQVEYQCEKLRLDIHDSVFGVIEAGLNLELSRKKLELEEKKYAITQQLYDIGEASYEEFQNAASALANVRQSGFDAERSVLNARVKLIQLLGISSDKIDVEDIPADKALVMQKEKEKQLEQERTLGTTSVTLASLKIELNSLLIQLDATPVYRPDLSLSAGINIPLSSLSLEASISLNFSPTDIKTDDRADIKEEIEQQHKEIAIEELNLQLQERMLEQGLAITQQILEMRKTELDQAETSLKEAEYLHTEGERTDIELAQASINLESARNSLLSSIAAVLKAQAQLLLLYGSF